MLRRLHGGGANARNRQLDEDRAPAAAANEPARGEVVGFASALAVRNQVRPAAPIGPYVADFYCPAAKLVIEVDGLVHDFAGPAEHDDRRNAYIRDLGLEVVRIPASDVFRDATGVANSLVALRAEAVGPSTTQLR
jgi:very-short-patch-repair endonuclease